MASENLRRFNSNNILYSQLSEEVENTPSGNITSINTLSPTLIRQEVIPENTDGFTFSVDVKWMTRALVYVLAEPDTIPHAIILKQSKLSGNGPAQEIYIAQNNGSFYYSITIPPGIDAIAVEIPNGQIVNPSDIKIVINADNLAPSTGIVLTQLPLEVP